MQNPSYVEEVVNVEIEDVHEDSKQSSSNKPANQTNSLCCICLDKKKEVLLAPCGHYRYCPTCAQSLQDRGLPCSICKQRFYGIIKVYD
uniref:RING-type domain-containing protein n=1 Tax=Acrobeloides nanus TaxID=290746 RepID=A0A914E193_9BILA